MLDKYILACFKMLAVLNQIAIRDILIYLRKQPSSCSSSLPSFLCGHLLLCYLADFQNMACTQYLKAFWE